MKFLNTIVPLAAVTSAFVVPDKKLTVQIISETKEPSTFLERIKDNVDDVWTGIEDAFKDTVALSGNAIDNAFNVASDARKKAAATIECHASMTKFATQEWLNSAETTIEEFDLFGGGDHPPPHHPPPPHHGPPHHGPPHKGPHHGPPHKPNQTVYELIAGSKYTTKLAKLIGEYPDLVKALNGTKANYTIFAPTDAAFEKIPDHHKKPSKELIEKVLSYHVSADFYPAGRILVSHTIPTALKEDALGGEPQRLRVALGFGGLKVNFYSKVVAANIVCNSPEI